MITGVTVDRHYGSSYGRSLDYGGWRYDLGFDVPANLGHLEMAMGDGDDDARPDFGDSHKDFERWISFNLVVQGFGRCLWWQVGCGCYALMAAQVEDEIVVTGRLLCLLVVGWG